jgi:recombination protein RecT
MSENPSSVLAAPKLPENFLDPVLDDIEKVIPKNTITAAALTRIVVTAMNKTPSLRQCSKGSILACTLDIASIGLMPNTPQGFAYLIPYRHDGVVEATLQIGYKGFCELSYRSGQVKMIQADVVREGDEFDHEKGTETHIRHVKSLVPGRASRNLIAAWAAVELIGGGRNIEIMDAEELAKIQKIAERTKASPAWTQWPDEQRKKTVLKRMLKVLQVGSTPQIQKALEIEAQAFTPIEDVTTPAVPLLTSEDPPEHEVVATPVTPEKKSKKKRNDTDDPPPPGAVKRHKETGEWVDEQGSFLW